MNEHTTKHGCRPLTGLRRARADHEFARFRSTRDPDALAAVVHETSHSLMSAARAVTRDFGTAEDLVQNTYVAAMDRASAYDPDYPVTPWLLGILHNRARRLRRDESRTPDPGRLRQDATTRDPHDRAAEREMYARLENAIRALPDIYRPVLRLHVFYRMAPFEIASALRRCHSTVRTQLMRGLERLRAELDEEWEPGAAS